MSESNEQMINTSRISFNHFRVFRVTVDIGRRVHVVNYAADSDSVLKSGPQREKIVL